MRRDRAILMGVLALEMLGGCAQYNAQAVRRETFTQSSPYMVFDTPPVAQVAEAQARAGVGAPWWTDRNDSRLNPRDAIAPGPVSLYEVRIYDYQQSYDDHVHDHYNRTVRSVEFGQGSR